MKKRGAALVMVIVIIFLLLVVSTAALTMASSSFKTHISVDNMDKVNLAARSGIQLGIAKVNKDRTNLNRLIPVPFYENTVTCDVTFSLDSQSYIIINSHAYFNNKKYEKKLTYNTKIKLISSDEETIADYFAKNPLNSLGDINDSGVSVVIGNGSNCVTNIYGNLNVQGNSVELNSELNVTGDISAIAKNDVIYKWDNPTSPKNLYIQAGGDATIQSNLKVSNSAKVLANGDITLSWVTTKLDGTAQFQSGKDIILQNDLNNSANLSFVAARDINLQHKSNDINSNGPIYMQGGRDIILNKSIISTAPVTMIAGNNIPFASYTYNISGQTYLKAGNTINVPNRVTVNLGSTYIESNILNYNGGIIKSNSIPPKIDTCVNSIQHESWGGDLIPSNTPVPPRAPSPPAVAPAPLAAVKSVNRIKQLNSSIPYSTKYETTYSDLAFIKIKGSDTEAIKYALNPPAGTFTNPNTLKFVMIDGDVNLDWRFDGLVPNNTFKNYIIYCTGTFGIAWKPYIFNNSSIIAKSLNILTENFTISQINSSVMTDFIKDRINEYCNRHLQ